MNEVFVIDQTNPDLTDESLYRIEEIRSVYLGRCYMICSLVRVKKFTSVSYRVRKDRDLTGLKYVDQIILLKAFKQMSAFKFFH